MSLTEALWPDDPPECVPCNCNCSCGEPKVAVGSILYGFCGGYFGNGINAYDTKRVEAMGPDWVVARSTEYGATVFTHAGDPQLLAEYLIDPEPDW